MKAPQVQSSAIQWDGKLPFTWHTQNALTLHTAEVAVDSIIAPCDGTIVAVIANLTEAPGTAAGGLQIGIVGDADYFLFHDFATTDATGVYDITGSLLLATVTKGQKLVFGADGVATTTGLVEVTVVIMPRNA